MNDKTMTFSLGNEQEREIHEIMFVVYNALKEKKVIILSTKLSDIFFLRTRHTLQRTTMRAALFAK